MVWLEIRVSQFGSAFSPRDEAELATIMEGTLQLPARRVYCEAEQEIAWCFAKVEEFPRVGVRQLCVHLDALEDVFEQQTQRSLDTVGVVEEREVRRLVPEAVPMG